MKYSCTGTGFATRLRIEDTRDLSRTLKTSAEIEIVIIDFLKMRTLVENYVKKRILKIVD
jgi:hypothetical protein